MYSLVADSVVSGAQKRRYAFTFIREGKGEGKRGPIHDVKKKKRKKRPGVSLKRGKGGKIGNERRRVGSPRSKSRKAHHLRKEKGGKPPMNLL